MFSMSNPDTQKKADCTEHCNINYSDPFSTENYSTQAPARGEPEKKESASADEDQDNTLSPDSFLSRLYSLPIIHDSVETVEFYANKTSLSKFALEQTKTTFDQAKFVASHFASKYKYQMDRVDQLGCRSLDALEDTFPMMHQHPGEVLTEIKASPHKLYTDAKDKLTTTVSRPITFAADNLEFLIDKYLPKRDGNESVTDEPTMTETTRLLSLANQVMNRIAYRLKFDYSRADLYQLLETNKLLSNVTQSITDTYYRLFETVQSFKGEFQTKSSQRIDEWTLNLIHSLNKAVHHLKLHLVYLGPFQPLVNPLVNFVTHKYDIIRGEALKPDVGPLKKATNILYLTGQYVLPLMQESTHYIQKKIDHSKVYPHNTTVGNNVKSDVDVKTLAENRERQN